MSYEERGLYQKYIVRRADGSSGVGGKHEHCEYFVLDLVHDKRALVALEAYANDCADDYPSLFDDLNDKLAASRFCPSVSHKSFSREGRDKRCDSPAVIPLGNGVWFCVEHARKYDELANLGRQGAASLARRLAKAHGHPLPHAGEKT